MPQARALGPLGGVAVLEFREIQAGTEVIPVPGQHHGAHIPRKRVEELPQLQYKRTGERIALGRAIELENRDVVVAVNLEF